MPETPPHVVIVGCGRVGAGLARQLRDNDHTVAVIDADPAAFRRVRDADVQTVTGVGFDRETLMTAGVERASAVAAVTNGDNSNIVVARTARERFGVERVFARIYDQRRAAIYERLGIPTVASTMLTIEMAMRKMVPEDDGIRWVDPSAACAWSNATCRPASSVPGTTSSRRTAPPGSSPSAASASASSGVPSSSPRRVTASMRR
ncbi:MAG: TrkA family potassium uptake protein [Acidimicrobiales bacterium]